MWNNSKNTEGIDSNLLQAVKGNKALAKRLLDQARLKYPGKSERWYAKKVIYDLERDRAGSRGSSNSYKFNQREMRENIYAAGAFLSILTFFSSFMNGLFRGR